MTTLTLTHRAEQGTILDGTARGDGSGAVLKTNGWRWSRTLGAWYLPRTRDQHPHTRTIGASVDALRAAGFDVVVDVVDDWRPAEQVEADKIARQADRVDALSERAQRAAQGADAAWAAHEAAVDRLPEGGEPIKVGHHSEAGHRRAIERAHTSARRALDADARAEHIQERADSAAATTGARYAPVTVANRIEKIGADIRRMERGVERDVYDPEVGCVPASDELKARRAAAAAPRLAQLRDSLAYWQGVRDEQIASGAATNYDRTTIKAGDQVAIRGHWYPVVRANLKTVTVRVDEGWTNTSPYAEVTDHRPAA